MSQRPSHLFDEDSIFLTDAGMETALIFHLGHELPELATFPLLESEAGGTPSRLLRAVPRARAHARAGFILGGCTWRASADGRRARL